MTNPNDRIAFPVSCLLSSSVFVSLVHLGESLVSLVNHPSLLELILAICLLFNPVAILLSPPSEVLLDEFRVMLIHKSIHSVL